MHDQAKITPVVGSAFITKDLSGFGKPDRSVFVSIKIEPRETEWGEDFVVTTKTDNAFPTRTVILATGVNPIRLQVPDEFLAFGRGLSYSAVSREQET